jgi:hypothetical protein
LRKSLKYKKGFNLNDVVISLNKKNKMSIGQSAPTLLPTPWPAFRPKKFMIAFPLQKGATHGKIWTGLKK